MAGQSLRITEFDEAEVITATYVQSGGKDRGLSRVDVIVCLALRLPSCLRTLVLTYDSLQRASNRYGKMPWTCSYRWDTLTA